MSYLRLFPLIVLMAVSCRNDQPVGDSIGSRPDPSAREQADIDKSLTGQKVGQLISGHISWFKGGKYRKGSLDRVPDLYLFYYTASW